VFVCVYLLLTGVIGTPMHKLSGPKVGHCLSSGFSSDAVDSTVLGSTSFSIEEVRG